MRALLIVLGLAGLLAAGAVASLDRGEATPRFGRGTATITTSTRTVVLRVEIARTDSQRALGLMQRRSLAPDAGMVFVYEQPSTGGFWMKNTLIPLDIAFYDVRGRIVRILRMEPCKKDPCPIYSPEATYRGALEVNAGSFRRWNARRGDRIVVRPSTKTG
jgi:uncharacterized membrane protein (UPF0127 family)